MIYVYTSLTDGFDNLRPPCCPVDANVRYVCFTNIPNLPRVFPWEYRPVYPVGDACRTARVPKILPHLMLPDDAEYSIYHDGNFQLRLDPNGMIGELLGPEQWAAHKHPCRNCIYEEADILLKEKIGTRDLIEGEVERYKAQQYPKNAGLWANGLIVRRHTPEVAELNEAWWKLYSEGCERDQLSFPVAMRRSRCPVRTIDANVFSSPWIRFNWHAAWRDRDDNPDFWAQRNRVRGRLEQLKELTGVHAVQYVGY